MTSTLSSGHHSHSLVSDLLSAHRLNLLVAFRQIAFTATPKSSPAALQVLAPMEDGGHPVHPVLMTPGEFVSKWGNASAWTDGQPEAQAAQAADQAPTSAAAKRHGSADQAPTSAAATKARRLAKAEDIVVGLAESSSAQNCKSGVVSTESQTLAKQLYVRLSQVDKVIPHPPNLVDIHIKVRRQDSQILLVPITDDASAAIPNPFTRGAFVTTATAPVDNDAGGGNKAIDLFPLSRPWVRLPSLPGGIEVSELPMPGHEQPMELQDEAPTGAAGRDVTPSPLRRAWERMGLTAEERLLAKQLE